MADGLVDRGHDVTLFASGGSKTKGTLVSPLQKSPALADMGRRVTDDTIHTLSAYLHADEFDVIHDHSGWGRLRRPPERSPPVVRTLHRPWSDPARRLHAALAGRVHLVAISESQASLNKDLSYEGVVSPASGDQGLVGVVEAMVDRTSPRWCSSGLGPGGARRGGTAG